MIARVWTGTTRAADADAYAAYLHMTGVPELRSTPGNLGVHVLRSVGGDRAAFVVLSFWESLEAIRAFAGEDVGRPRYYPEDERFLLHRPERVSHYDVLDAPAGIP